MSLDAIVKGLLDDMAANSTPKLWELAPPQGREMYRMIANTLEPQGISIGKTENMSIPGPAAPIQIRIYTPVAGGPGIDMFSVLPMEMP